MKAGGNGMKKVYQKIRRLLAGGIVGEIRTFEVCAGNHEAVEMICLIQELIDQKILIEHCRTSSADDRCHAFTSGCILTSEKGVSGMLNVSRSCCGNEYLDIVITGTKGVMKISEWPHFQMTLTDQDGDEVLYELSGTLGYKLKETQQL